MNLEGKRILVTGGTGFLGSGLVRGLLQRGAKVRTFDDDSRGAPRKLAGVLDRIEIVRGDVRDAKSVEDAAEGCDGVCHLAYLNGTEFFYTKPELVLDIAVRGMMNVLDACRKKGVKDLVLASSSEVYQTPPTVPTAEAVPLSVPDPLNARYSYGGGKIISELLAINYGRTGFDRVAIFRPHNAYGPDMGHEHVIPQLVNRICDVSKLEKKVIDLPIQGTGVETRAFVFIDDMVDGMVRIAEKGEHLGIYHVGTQEEVSIATLAKTIGDVMGIEVRLVSGELQPGGTPRRCPDITKLRGLGYEPKVNLRAGLEKTVPWYVQAWKEKSKS